GEVQTIAHDESVRNNEADKIGFESHFAPALFVEQHADLEALGLEFADHAGDQCQGFPRVQNIVDEEDVAIGDVQGQAVHELRCADRLRLVAVTRDTDTIEAGRVLDFAQKVSGEQNCAVDNRND